VGPQGRSGRVQKLSPSTGFDPRTVQPVASRYNEGVAGASFTGGRIAKNTAHVRMNGTVTIVTEWWNCSAEECRPARSDIGSPVVIKYCTCCKILKLCILSTRFIYLFLWF